jgi:hypothetical protein
VDERNGLSEKRVRAGSATGGRRADGRPRAQAAAGAAVDDKLARFGKWRDGARPPPLPARQQPASSLLPCQQTPAPARGPSSRPGLWDRWGRSRSVPSPSIQGHIRPPRAAAQARRQSWRPGTRTARTPSRYPPPRRARVLFEATAEAPSPFVPAPTGSGASRGGAAGLHAGGDDPPRGRPTLPAHSGSRPPPGAGGAAGWSGHAPGSHGAGPLSPPAPGCAGPQGRGAWEHARAAGWRAGPPPDAPCSLHHLHVRLMHGPSRFTREAQAIRPPPFLPTTLRRARGRLLPAAPPPGRGPAERLGALQVVVPSGAVPGDTLSRPLPEPPAADVIVATIVRGS